MSTMSNNDPLSVPQFTLGGMLRFVLILVISTLLLWYIVFQARLLITGPSLTLDTDTPSLATTRAITLSGTAGNIVSLTLDNRPIFTDDSGAFHEQLVLEYGYTIMTLRARDRYGREKTLTKQFVYTPAYTQKAQTI